MPNPGTRVKPRVYTRAGVAGLLLLYLMSVPVIGGLAALSLERFGLSPITLIYGMFLGLMLSAVVVTARFARYVWRTGTVRIDPAALPMAEQRMYRWSGVVWDRTCAPPITAAAKAPVGIRTLQKAEDTTTDTPRHWWTDTGIRNEVQDDLQQVSVRRR